MPGLYVNNSLDRTGYGCLESLGAGAIMSLIVCAMIRQYFNRSGILT